MKPISLNYLTGQMKNLAFVFHNNWDSFDMVIFITIIQPKIHKSSGLK